MTGRTLRDQADRDVIANDLTSTLVVEAAAGTGKTTELVNRIVRIIERGLAQVQEVVAVTFTEKAAGELKLRLREKLEKSRGEASGLERERLGQALAHLEEARVSTIHGFCAEILRERPVEARLDPLFTTLTESQSQQLFDRAFMSWLQEQLDDPPEGVRRALRRTSVLSAFRRSSGSGQASADSDPDAPIDRLRNAAWKLADWRDFAREWRRPHFDREREIDRLVGQLHAFVDLTSDPSWDGDPLWQGTLRVRQASEAMGRAQESGRSDYDGWEARLVDLTHESLDRFKTGKSSFYKAGLPRPEVVAARDALVQDLKHFCELVDADLAALLASELRGALDRYEALKQRDGSADFLDLLLRARDLLSQNDEVRCTFQARFKRIFVDEFQDTDPLQADVVLMLAGDGGATGRIIPGKLFIVADPKQSIYRFRRADVGVYYRVRDLLEEQGASRVRLTTSFRAQPAIQALVNAAFEPEMTGDREVLQADYVALDRYRDELSGQPAIISLPVPRPYGRMRGRVAKYAIEESLPPAVAAHVEWLIRDSNWRVSVPGMDGATEPLVARHICVLFRRFITWGDDVTRPYVDALEARGIPHVLVGGRTFHEREEVENMRAALAAVEWPDDELSVFATLRGPLFAIGDEELLEWRHRIGHFHPFSPVVSGFVRPEGAVSGFRRTNPSVPDLPDRLRSIAESLSLLRTLHVARNHRPVADTVHRLLDATRAHVSFVLRPRGEQVLANVLQVAELARQYELEGGLSFRGFVERLREESQSARAAEAPVIEEGAEGVRLMTVHKAKGLEFPVVMLADITAKLAQRDPDRFMDTPSNLCVLKLGGWMPVELREQGGRESARDEAEGTRLAYVAATRARDLLVIPAVGDKPFDEGWLRPLNRAIYPPLDRRRDQREAPGCPGFKSRDSVLQRPGDDPATVETVCPGLHAFSRVPESGYSVAWWDPRALQLEAEVGSGIRRPELITKDASPEVISAGLAAYESWRGLRQAAIEAGSRPSVRVHPATAWAARSDLGLSIADLPDVEVVEVDLPRDRPSGARFGSLVHSVLSVAPLDADGEAIRRTAEIHGRILGAPAHEVDAVLSVVASILEHPIMDRVRSAVAAGTLKRELPVTLCTETGELVEGVIDLAFDEGERTVLVDFKTDSDVRPNLSRYRRQLQLYSAAVEGATRRRSKVILLLAKRPPLLSP